MKRKLKLYVALVISFLPLSWVRVFLYRFLLRYKISPKAKIGYGTLIAVDKAVIGKVSILRFNRLKGPYELEIDEDVSLGCHNIIDCPDWVLQKPYSDEDYSRRFKVGKKVLITSNHYFDVTGGIELKEGTWIAGYGSQFWTHGLGVKDRSIVIGKNCYVSSASRFSPGSEIADKSVVSLGSVVTKKFDKKEILIGGVPAKILKENYKAPNT